MSDVPQWARDMVLAEREVFATTAAVETARRAAAAAEEWLDDARRARREWLASVSERAEQLEGMSVGRR